MRAIRFHYRPVRYLLTRSLSGRLPTVGVGPLGSVSLDDVEPVELPGPRWVRLTSRMSGICGSDLAAITAHDSFTLEPFGAYPFTFGHEVIGAVTETGPDVTRWNTGDRVIVNPMLACEQREMEPCGACARGDYGLCRRAGEGQGTLIGYSPMTGGGWATELVAHESQLHPQGDLTDDVAVLTDAFASAAKGVFMEPPAEGDVVLVVGAGTIGLLTVRALRLTGWDGMIAVSARYDFQAQRAEALGADLVIRSREEMYRWAETLPGATPYDPTLAPRFVEGGPSLIYDTIASRATIGDALALAREGGRIVMVGSAARAKVDWTRVWYRQLRVIGVFVYGPVTYRGEEQDVFDASLSLIRAGGLDGLDLVTHVFALEDYREAIAVALGKRGHKSVKVAFRPDG